MKFFLVVLAATLALASAGQVQPSLRAGIKGGKISEAIIELPQVMDQVEKTMALQTLPKEEKVTTMVAMLEGLTNAAQAPYVARIKSLGLEYEQFWASNIILVKGLTEEALAKLESVEGEFTIREQNYAHAFPAVKGPEVNISQSAQWGVTQIRSQAAWTRTTGEGVVVAIIDTGVNANHVALSAGYAGAWRDPYYSTANPTDQNGHGSHCAGTIAGRANGVGVAPGARWIACRGLNHQGSGSESALTTCAQFMLTANPRPNIVSNSWGGGQGNTWYNSQIQAWRNVGIIPIFAIGNSGSSCRTANSPGDQPLAISVGATTATDAMASFSSRGPSTSGIQKPEVSAPGNAIVSCGTGTSNYVSMSGTSMAAPHVAGAAALVLSANPNFSITQVQSALQTTAATPTLSNADRNCGLPSSGNFPNYAFGHGRIDVGRALGV